MSFRLSPYKILRLIALVAVVSYAGVEISEFRKNKIKETEEIAKTLNIRKKDFYNSQEEKQKIMENIEKEGLLDENTLAEGQNEPQDTKVKSDEKTNAANPPTQQDIDKQKAVRTAEEKKKQEEASQKKIANQIAQQKKDIAEKKVKESEIAAARKLQEKKEAEAREAERKVKEKAAAEEARKKAAAANTAKKMNKKYIQVATLNSEAAAKEAVNKLGSNFNYQRISGKGRTLYVIVSISTDNPDTLSSLQEQVKSKLKGTKYIIRTVGK